VSAVPDYEYVHELVDRLTPDQLAEVRAHALRLAAGRRTFVPWAEARAAMASLPAVDYSLLRAEVDEWLDQDRLLGDDR
jgi:hypothetical protein